MHPLEISLLVLALLEDLVSAQQQYTAVPRWGQAAALVNNVLYVHGGRTDEFNMFAYSSSPVNNDFLYLPLNTSFDITSPPWQYVSGCSSCETSQGPAVAWHTLTAYDASNLLLFGGDAGPNGPISAPEAADSAALLDVSDRLQPAWQLETASWMNEPLRRIYHTACEAGGKIFLIGGEKTDGSGNAFSDHYVYDPQRPAFTQLSATNGPSDLLGHASVILPDQRMIVFGGYSPSVNVLTPFSAIWSLDTSNLNHTWSALEVSGTVLPSPRRGFAAAALGNGKVLIQGGADADMQNVFSDGWILDTTQSPMFWSRVDALSEVGPRRDHFAVALGTEVIFGFGYGQFAPVNASLLLFDAEKAEFVSSYTPPPAVTNPTTTLPGSSTTPHSPSGTGGVSSSTRGSSPTSTGNPGSPPDGNDPQGNSAKSRTTAVALGVVFGVLGVVAGGAAAYWMSTRRRASAHNRFHLLGPSDDDDSPHLGPVIPIAGAVGARDNVPVAQNVKQKLAGLMPGRTGRPPMRRDMLADEDTRVFEPSWYDVRREGSMRSWSTAGRGLRPTLGDVVQGSLTSLKNVGGAMLAYASGNRKIRETSGTSSMTYWDKDALNYSDKVGLVVLPGLDRGASRPKGGRKETSYVSQKSYYYEDPFEEYEIEAFKMPGDDDYDPDAVELHSPPSLEDPPPKPYLYNRVLPATEDVTRLTPLSEKPSFTTVSDPTSSSDSSHLSPYNRPSSSEYSPSSLDTPRSPRRLSSIIDANSPITSTMKRSDTWWSRFAKTPLLDRARSTDNRLSKPLDFRDPNPPPRLLPIKETSNSLSPEDPPLKRGGRDDPMYGSIHHGRSATSLQTSKTADSVEIEQMARTMDIVQRGTMSSHGSRASTGSDGTTLEHDPHPQPSRGPLSVIIPADDHNASGPHALSPTAHDLVQSPTAMSPVNPAQVQRPLPVRRPTAGTNVAARVEAFEHQARPRSPPAAPAGNRTKRGRSGSLYGLAPKPSLFVANPDRRMGSGDS